VQDNTWRYYEGSSDASCFVLPPEIAFSTPSPPTTVANTTSPSTTTFVVGASTTTPITTTTATASASATTVTTASADTTTTTTTTTTASASATASATVVPSLPGTCAGVIFLDENQNQVHDLSRRKRKPAYLFQARAMEPVVPGVTIIITDSLGVSRSTVTDGNGFFSIGGVAPGPAMLNVIVPMGFFLTTLPNPRTIVVPGDGGTHFPITDGVGLVRIEPGVDVVTGDDLPPLIIGGAIIALLIIMCCCCFWCRVPWASRHVHREALPLYHHIVHVGEVTKKGR